MNHEHLYWALTALTAVAVFCNVLSDAFVKDATQRHGWDVTASIFIVAWIIATVVNLTSS